MMRDQQATENLACLSDPESVSLLYIENLHFFNRYCLYSLQFVVVCVFTAPDVLCCCNLYGILYVLGRQIDRTNPLCPNSTPLQRH